MLSLAAGGYGENESIQCNTYGLTYVDRRAQLLATLPKYLSYQFYFTAEKTLSRSNSSQKSN